MVCPPGCSYISSKGKGMARHLVVVICFYNMVIVQKHSGKLFYCVNMYILVYDIFGEEKVKLIRYKVK